MALAKRYKAKESEPRLQKQWADDGIYNYNPDSGKEVYAIDTPPPTVSGMIHMGHIFSYVQAEVLARYQRMTGKEVFYPFCFDDNGLPSERFTEKVKKVKAQDMTRGEFVKLCLEVAKDAEKQFRDLWNSFGFSCDWSLMYTTIDPWVQRISQRSFLDLVNKERVYRKEAPTLWCPECQTAVAQAETEDKEFPSHFHDLEFKLSDGSGVIPIATTRPELIPACVAVFVNPEDDRWKNLVGQKVMVPLYDREVTILADPKVDIEKGSGAVMCCTFGDTTDIEWWGEHNLDLRIILDNRGHMNDKAGFLEGMYWKKARKAIVAKLDEDGYRVGGKDISHAVNVHERCGTPLEYLVNRQWFIKVLDRKDELIEKGNEINWYPAHFKVRYDHWVENLKWDWCISRQRFYGVPFPVWFCEKCDTPIFADAESLPVDPLVDSPGKTCPKCGSTQFKPESDVMDTWATSSLTPQINMKWGEEDQREKVFPMALRPQAHDIIRTWAFYTIAKALLHENTIPWKDVMISGHSLNPNRQKMSKSKGNVAGDPIAALNQFSADELRFWACSSKLGTDVVFSKDVLGDGRRLVTKLWNASKFAETRLAEFDPEKKVKLHAFDKWLLSRLTETVSKATAGMKIYEYSTAMREAETFFWKALCDNYLEIAKNRLYGEDEEAKAAAQFTLYTALYTTLRLFAPVMVHVTEELYLELFKPFEKIASIHLAPWPDNDYMDKEALELGNKALISIEQARKWKSENSLSMATEMESITVDADLKQFSADLMAVTRAKKIIFDT